MYSMGNRERGVTMENNRREIRCRYCHYQFKPEPVITKKGKKKTAYIECPRCGNGQESNYQTRKAAKYREV